MLPTFPPTGSGRSHIASLPVSPAQASAPLSPAAAGALTNLLSDEAVMSPGALTDNLDNFLAQINASYQNGDPGTSAGGTADGSGAGGASGGGADPAQAALEALLEGTAGQGSAGSGTAVPAARTSSDRETANVQAFSGRPSSNSGDSLSLGASAKDLAAKVTQMSGGGELTLGRDTVTTIDTLGMSSLKLQPNGGSASTSAYLENGASSSSSGGSGDRDRSAGEGVAGGVSGTATEEEHSATRASGRAGAATISKDVQDMIGAVFANNEPDRKLTSSGKREEEEYDPFASGTPTSGAEGANAAEPMDEEEFEDVDAIGS